MTLSGHPLEYILVMVSTQTPFCVQSSSFSMITTRLVMIWSARCIRIRCQFSCLRQINLFFENLTIVRMLLFFLLYQAFDSAGPSLSTSSAKFVCLLVPPSKGQMSNALLPLVETPKGKRWKTYGPRCFGPMSCWVLPPPKASIAYTPVGPSFPH